MSCGVRDNDSSLFATDSYAAVLSRSFFRFIVWWCCACLQAIATNRRDGFTTEPTSSFSSQHQQVTAKALLLQSKPVSKSAADTAATMPKASANAEVSVLVLSLVRLFLQQIVTLLFYPAQAMGTKRADCFTTEPTSSSSTPW